MHPWSLCVRMYQRLFDRLKKKKKNCFLTNFLTIEPEFSKRQTKGRFAGVIAGTCHVSSLFFAWWMRRLLWTVPWHATKFKSMMTSLTFLWSARSADGHRSVETRRRRWRWHTSSCDALQITFWVSIFMPRAPGIIFCVWLRIFKIVTPSSMKWHKRYTC